jgi:hypothetical protein
LQNLALIKAFHTGTNKPVRGPLGRIWNMSQEKFFLLSFLAMFCYFFLPGFIFPALSYFSWITWIAPDNVVLTAICGMQGGMGFNPWPSFDYNIAMSSGYPALTIPTFTVVNLFVSAVLGGLM